MAESKAYLMSLSEYLSKVVPILKEYKNFLKKNNYFISVEYGGLPFLSYPELIQGMNEKKNMGFLMDFSKPDQFKRTPEVVAQDGWNRNTRDLKSIISKDAPLDIIETKNRYANTLKDIFGEQYFNRFIGEPDNLKSNKRVIKYAIDYDIYKKLLEDLEVTPTQLEEVAKSADVKLPKKLFVGSIARREAIYSEMVSKMPNINKDILNRLVEDILKSMQPICDSVFDKVHKMYSSRIIAYVNGEKNAPNGLISPSSLENNIPFWIKIFNILELVKQKEEVRNARGIVSHEFVPYYKGLSLKKDWEAELKKYVTEYVESLKVNFIHSILNAFNKITLKIASFHKLNLVVGARGFEGEYRFIFENGSSFDYRTEAIYAGGHTIQVLHLRYLTDFLNATLSDSTILKNPSLATIVEHFSDKLESEMLFNPYIRVNNAKTVEDIAEALYSFLKTKGEYKGVRKNSSKIDASLSFALQSYSPDWKKRKYQHGIYFKRDIPLGDNKAKAIVLLDEAKAPTPTVSQVDIVEHNQIDKDMEKKIDLYVEIHKVTRDYAARKIAERKTINLPDSFEDGGTILEQEYNENVTENIGGIAKKMTLKELADMHLVPEIEIVKEMGKGAKHEREHTDNPAIAWIIAKDHIYENPQYYSILEKVDM